jgi:dipeptide transport system ATP-binding protein
MNILSVNNLKKTYEINKMFQETKYLNALNGVSFDLKEGETLGIVGESGCGKSTLAKVLTQLESITSGSIKIQNREISQIDNHEFHSLIQMVFQDPYQSLNPRKKAFDIIADPLYINQKNLTQNEIYKKVEAAMDKVGLRTEFMNRYPHQFSGGQRQRLGIARALMLRPKILILDEPVSALDVSIQAQVLNLLIELQKEMQLTYLFISHDLSVIAHMSDKIIVMYLGKIVEYGTRDQIFNTPKHPYTKVLLESAPTLNKEKSNSIEVRGELPSPFNLPIGCAFYARCPYASPECMEKEVILRTIDQRLVACVHTF